MRIALDAIPLVHAKTGIGHYTAALAEWLAKNNQKHQYELLSPFDFNFDIRDGRPDNLSKRFLPVRSVFRKWWLVGLPTMLLISPVDLFHGTNYSVPIFATCPTVVTIHDMSLFAQAHTHESINVVRGKRRIPIMARRASMIIAPSEYTKREIVKYLGTPAEKIEIIYEAARENMQPLPLSDCQSVLEKHQIKRPYILYVGTIEPRKNLITLIRAYHEVLKTTSHRPQLVFCGGRGWLDSDVFSLVEELRLQDLVRFTGYVDEVDLPALYSAAQVFVYPSLYEGFGLPPLEAMACGTPVVVSNSSSLPEVVADAGITHDPYDYQALAESVIKLFDDAAMHKHYQNAGLEQASRFSWERAARETQSVYDDLFYGKKRGARGERGERYERPEYSTDTRT
jgi:glycosyltransferase involved in cell wall biosynthesis